MQVNKVISYINKISNLIKKHTFTSCFISGIIFATPLMCEWLFPLTFLSLFLLFYAVGNREKRGALRSFFLFFLGCYLIVYTLFFKLYPFEGFGFTEAQGKAIVIFGWIGASIIHSVMGSIILGISRFFKKEPLFYALSCGTLWIIYEWSLSLGELAFPWVTISVSLIKFLPFLQTASLFGNGFITFVAVFFSCSAALYTLSKDRKFVLKLASAILAANTLAGTVLYIIPENKEKEVSVCIVQGNVSMGDKWQGNNFLDILTSHSELIQKAFEKQHYDTVILAETVFPAAYTENGYIYNVMSDLAEKYDTTIILGVIIKSDDEKKYNSIIAIRPDGTTSGPYHKRMLVPFGEKTPYMGLFSKIVPSLGDLNMEKDSYIPGTESGTVTDHGGNVYGPLVCYDSVFSDFARENVLKGAEIIAVSTNDSWYKDGKAVWQHRSHSIIKAIENGRYVYRSANTGISCIITSKGNVTAESEVMTEATVCGTGYASSSKTLYTILGNVSLYLSFTAIPLLFVLKGVKNHLKTKKEAI